MDANEILKKKKNACKPRDLSTASWLNANGALCQWTMISRTVRGCICIEAFNIHCHEIAPFLSTRDITQNTEKISQGMGMMLVVDWDVKRTNRIRLSPSV